ncbi:MAG: hypothetical protein ACRDV0_06825 [Acidimicrobiales bacterium]
MSDTNDSPASAGAPVDAALAALDTEESVLLSRYDRIPRSAKVAVVMGAIVVVAVVLGVWHDFYFHWFEVHSGTVNESGPYYGFWSGFGSDIGEATIFVGIIATWRHHSCHVRGCARIGRTVEGTPYLACPKHHPEHKGFKRSISFEELHEAHRRAKGK